jgi:hypothetical protein
MAVNNIGRQNGDPGPHIDVAVTLVRWRTRELRKATRFRECGGATWADLEEIYDQSIHDLRDRSYESEEHLRAALHMAIKWRAQRLHRDRKAHSRILGRAAWGIQSQREEQARLLEPEEAALAAEDDAIIGEFISELTLDERRIFALIAEGKSWRAIATILEIEETEARNLKRAVEKKRERFVTLYETGRLCGYRSHTIGALLSGEQSSDMAWRQAIAHLRHCRDCQKQHHVTGKEMRTRFDERTLAVLPVPALLLTHVTLLDHLHGLLARPLQLFERFSSSNGAVRERLLESAAATGATAKVAGVVVSAAVFAGGVAADVHHELQHSRSHHRHHVNVMARSASLEPSPPAPRVTGISPPAPTPSTTPTDSSRSSRSSDSPTREFQPGEVVSSPAADGTYRSGPAVPVEPVGTPDTAAHASVVSRASPAPLPEVHQPGTGGQFTP